MSINKFIKLVIIHATTGLQLISIFLGLSAQKCIIKAQIYMYIENIINNNDQ